MDEFAAHFFLKELSKKFKKILFNYNLFFGKK